MAWFAGFGWSDPVLLGNLSPACIQVIDGKHRLRAAYVRGDNEIKVQIFEAEDSLSTLEMIKNLEVSV
jgi:ParB-like chromosome segregation protein Spo0J